MNRPGAKVTCLTGLVFLSEMPISLCKHWSESGFMFSRCILGGGGLIGIGTGGIILQRSHLHLCHQYVHMLTLNQIC